MAEIDIFNIPPNVVNRDLSYKSFLIYGDRKSGKTSNAVKFPKPLLVACERGYNMISGVRPQPINKWTEMLTVKKQLLQQAKKVEMHNKAVADGKIDEELQETDYKTVIVDTADIAYVYCEQYILQLEGVDNLDETVQMRGYKKVKREFDSFFQEIVKAGYTLVAISHSAVVQMKENGEKYDRIVPSVERRGFEVLAGLVDIIGYSTSELDEEGNVHSVLYMRGNKTLEAGSRNRYTSLKIPFTYEALRADMAQAMDKLEADGSQVIDTPINVFKEQSEQIDFDATVEAIKQIFLACRDVDKVDKYQDVITAHLGKNKTVRDCTRDQADIVGLILDDLKDVCTANNIVIQ